MRPCSEGTADYHAYAIDEVGDRERHDEQHRPHPARGQVACVRCTTRLAVPITAHPTVTTTASRTVFHNSVTVSWRKSSGDSSSHPTWLAWTIRNANGRSTKAAVTSHPHRQQHPARVAALTSASEQLHLLQQLDRRRAVAELRDGQRRRIELAERRQRRVRRATPDPIGYS